MAKLKAKEDKKTDNKEDDEEQEEGHREIDLEYHAVDEDGLGDDDIDDEEEGGEWVTEENLYKHMTSGIVAEPTSKSTQESSDQGTSGDQEEVKRAESEGENEDD